MFQAPEDIEVPEPVIVLSGDPTLPAGAIMGGPPQFVMPRPDPAHVNAGLLLPGELIKGASSPSVQLTIFVLQDGSVGEAKVERSCGEPEVDRLAMTHVEREWRFIPAYLGTQPVAHWMVVFVKFLG
jgi:protein TonB